MYSLFVCFYFKVHIKSARGTVKTRQKLNTFQVTPHAHIIRSCAQRRYEMKLTSHTSCANRTTEGNDAGKEVGSAEN